MRDIHMKKPCYLVVLILSILCVNSCKKSCKCEEGYKKIPESVKEWFWFGEGSQWIYRLSENDTIFDTVTVVFRKDDKSNFNCQTNYAKGISCSEVLSLGLSHTNVQYFPRILKDTVLAALDEIQAYSVHGGREFIHYEPHGTIIGFPIIINEKYENFSIKDTLVNIKVLNKNYNHVVHTAQADLPYENKATEIWWTKGVGLIKVIKIDKTNQKNTWELVKYDLK